MAFEPMAVKLMYTFRPKASSMGQRPRAHYLYPFTGAKKRENISPKILVYITLVNKLFMGKDFISSQGDHCYLNHVMASNNFGHRVMV